MARWVLEDRGRSLDRSTRIRLLSTVSSGRKDDLNLMPKVAVALAVLASLAWIVLPTYSSGQSLLQVSGGSPLIVLLIPVVLSIWGIFSDGRERIAGAMLLLFSLMVFFLSGILMGLSYLPSSILLLIPPLRSFHRRTGS
jgi:hypothetical protein